jgi:hypothetical protein
LKVKNKCTFAEKNTQLTESEELFGQNGKKKASHLPTFSCRQTKRDDVGGSKRQERGSEAIINLAYKVHDDDDDGENIKSR